MDFSSFLRFKEFLSIYFKLNRSNKKENLIRKILPITNRKKTPKLSTTKSLPVKVPKLKVNYYQQPNKKSHKSFSKKSKENRFFSNKSDYSLKSNKYPRKNKVYYQNQIVLEVEAAVEKFPPTHNLYAHCIPLYIPFISIYF